MSIPPQLIRVKRKRADDESPVAFLQFEDDGPKRHRTGTHWVYQRRETRDAAAARLKDPTALANAVSKRDIKPVIHVSKPEGESAGASTASARHVASSSAGTTAPPRTKTLSPRPSLQKLRQERRRFHLSRSALSTTTTTSTNSDVPATGVSKRRSTSPAVFVERGRKKLIRKALQNATQQAQEKAPSPEPRTQAVAPAPPPPASEGAKEVFKRPGTRRVKPRSEDAPAQRAPLPASSAKPHTEDLDKIAAEMNQWVLDEIGANLEQMEAEKKKTQTQTTTSRFRPKAPPQRYAERHAETLQPPVTDAAMSDVTDEEGDDDDGDWVIDEYVRVPAKSMAVDISPAEVGVLVLDGEDDIQFFGDDYDEDDEYLEDDEDENAENHYTADYPEDEVDSDDEFNRHAYYYRNANASDEEEFDNNYYHSDSDDMVLNGDNDDAATMARIKAYMQRYRER